MVKRYCGDDGIPTLALALAEHMNADELKVLASLTKSPSALSGAPLPDTVARLLEDISDRCARIHDRGLARLVECADGAVAALVANDSRTRKYCMRAGERHLVIPAGSEAAFRRAPRDRVSGRPRTGSGARRRRADERPADQAGG